MITTTYTVEQLAALKAAAASGHLSVRYGDKTIEYQSLKELRNQIAAIEAELIATGQIAAPTAAARQRTAYASFTRD